MGGCTQHYNVYMIPVTGLRTVCVERGKEATFMFHLEKEQTECLSKRRDQYGYLAKTNTYEVEGYIFSAAKHVTDLIKGVLKFPWLIRQGTCSCSVDGCAHCDRNAKGGDICSEKYGYLRWHSTSK